MGKTERTELTVKKGSNGLNGKDGKDGISGKDGVNGKDGIGIKNSNNSSVNLGVVKNIEKFVTDLKVEENDLYVYYSDGSKKKLDLKKVMWSKGNNNERIRIAKLVEDNETIIDMFAGIGYFSIPIGVHSNAKQVYSIEINPNSFHYLKENIKLNKLNNIIPLLGDCMDITPEYSADRIIMGYVKTTHHYLKTAIDSLNKGGVIHYHETVPEKLMDTRPINRIKEVAGDRSVEFLKLNKVKKYSPGVFHVVCDARIN